MASSSPRTWGWTDDGRAGRAGDRRRPHARGGGPQQKQIAAWKKQRRPHARGGGPSGASRTLMTKSVVPTHVGVDRLASVMRRCASSSSPRTWGWTEPARLQRSRVQRRPHARGGGPDSYAHGGILGCVVPTHVGVDRIPAHAAVPARVVPTHVGVDRSDGGSPDRSRTSSPRTWGWTAERLFLAVDRPPSSPRTWGWTVGDARARLAWRRRPHARGGGPWYLLVATNTTPVVPTHVGVDRCRAKRRRAASPSGRPPEPRRRSRLRTRPDLRGCQPPVPDHRRTRHWWDRKAPPQALPGGVRTSPRCTSGTAAPAPGACTRPTRRCRAACSPPQTAPLR